MLKFDHVRRSVQERWAGEMYFMGKDRDPSTTPYCRRYMAAAPFHATFTVLFYFEGYIFLDFIARLARREIRSSSPPSFSGPRGFIKILYRPVFTSEIM